MSNNPSAFWAEVAQEVAPPMAAAKTSHSPMQQRRRRGFQPESDDGREAVNLVRDDGVLRWVYEPPQQQQRSARRAWRAVGVDRRDVVQRLEFPPLGRNQITDGLVLLDKKLNLQRGLHRWRDGSWQPIAADEIAALEGRVLLLVHGTFSKGQMYDTEFNATPDGRDLFERLTTPGKTYAAVLSFEHATLSVAPWLNAVELIDGLAPLAADRVRLDVVCHSRGGLVVGWALKLGRLPVDQVIFVGSPLMGTSLAAPNRLREALDLLANMADAMANVATGAALAFPPAKPLAMGAAGLARVLGRALNLGASLPIADALVGLVPGLMSQSRVINNLELDLLFPLPTQARLSGIGVTFKPKEIDQRWKFWNRFTNVTDQLKYAGADLIFDQPNDLVVDTASMNHMGKDKAGKKLLIAGVDWMFLGEKPDTHHCSYFRDGDALQFLDRRLK